MENLFFTSLTTPEVRKLLRDELEDFFENPHRTVGDNNKNEKPVTTKELCSFLGITEPTVIRWRKKGKIPFIQIGSAIRFNLSAVVQALEVTKKPKA